VGACYGVTGCGCFKKQIGEFGFAGFAVHRISSFPWATRRLAVVRILVCEASGG
jgi:hypothetical protein